jgi:mono/diheme cytochrome c family protein
MARHPGFRPLQQSAFFADKRSARPLVPGTVARQLVPGTVGRDRLDDDAALHTGKVEGASEWGHAGGIIGIAPQGFPALGLAAAGDPYIDFFPVEVNRKLLDRGRERFNIYCAMCHDQAGTGEGIVVRRGFATPPSFHETRLRQAKPGYIFNVITNGFGAMPDYSSQIKGRDRWAIVAYVKALQLNQELLAEGK